MLNTKKNKYKVFLAQFTIEVVPLIGEIGVSKQFN